jgi:methylated-DNA-[protein]-cysteine S-methyltransferase
MNRQYAQMSSPLGDMIVARDGDDVVRIALVNQAHLGDIDRFGVRNDDGSAQVREQLSEYFAGSRTSFDLALRAEGTDFQREVWKQLSTIPFGDTRSYAQVAAAIGRPRAVRAVGTANSRNPHAVVVPCHRVIGANGSLVGYAGGLDAKRYLLALEAR